MLFNFPLVTRTLLIINIALFLLQQFMGDILLAHFALWPWGEDRWTAINDQEISLGFRFWQLITYGFLHGNLFHLAFNMLALVMFGGAVEQLLRTRAYFIYYFSCIIGAALTQLVFLYFWPRGFFPTIGASGGVFGLLLAFALFYPHAKLMLLFPPIPMPARIFVLLYAAIELFLGITGTAAGIAHFAHLGGMVMGWLLIHYWRGRLPLKPKRILLR